MKIKLEESNEMADFGAEFVPSFNLPYIKGIIITKIYGLSSSKDKTLYSYLPDVVRIPKKMKYKTSYMNWLRKFRRRLTYFLLSEEGLITNILVVLIHLLIIVGVPFLILLAVTWSLIQIKTINEDINADIFTINDIFNSSSYNFWLDSMYGQNFFYIISGICWLFFLTGLIELIWYYATGARDTGKYIVSRTWQRWIATGSFWIMVLIYIGIYTAYLSMVLVWCILGAVLNPQKFLPFATGAVVIIGFWAMIYSKLKEVDETLKDVIGAAVDIGLKNSVMTNFEREKVKLANLMIKPVTGITQKMFYQAINGFMKEFNLPQIEKEITDKILEGDVSEIVLLFNKACGVDKNISLGLVGLLLNNQIMIMNSIYNLSEENGLNGELSVAITEIVLNSYNPSAIGINQVDSSVILSVKKIFSKMLPQFPHDILDIILQIVLEADPRPLGAMWKKMGMSSNFCDILIGIVTKNKSATQDSLFKFASEIIPKGYKEVFLVLHYIIKGDITKNYDFLANCLNVKHSFLIKMIIAIYKIEEQLTRQVLGELDKNLMSLDPKLKDVIDMDSMTQFKNHLRVFHQLLNGDEIDLVKLIKRSIPEFDSKVIRTLKASSDGNMEHFAKIIDGLGLSMHKNCILEFFKLITSGDTNLIEIGKRIEVDKENIDVLKSLFKFVIVSSKFFIYIKPKFDQIKLQNNIVASDSILDEHKIRYREAVDFAKKKLAKWLQVFIKRNTIKVKSFGFKGVFSNIKSFAKDAITDLGGYGTVEDILKAKSINAQLSDADIDKFETNTVNSVSLLSNMILRLLKVTKRFAKR